MGKKEYFNNIKIDKDLKTQTNIISKAASARIALINN